MRHKPFRLHFLTYAVSLVLVACTAPTPMPTNIGTNAQSATPPVTLVLSPTLLPTPIFTPSLIPTEVSTGTASDIEFVLNDTYKIGETVEVKIRNAGKVSYLYSQYYAACDLSYFDASGRKFLIPPGTHCDIIYFVEIKPGETKVLFTWGLSECIEDQWGCVKSRSLPEGTYTLRGAFNTATPPEFTAVAEAIIKIVR